MSAPARVEHLDAVPALGELYARALARAARAAMLNPKPIRTLPPVTYAVDGVHADADRLTAYQHLFGEPGTDALPAGYVHVLAFPVAVAIMARPDFPLPLLGMVHLANRVTQRRELHLTDTLSIRAWSRGLAAHRSGTQVELVVEVSDADGVAWTGVSTYLAKKIRIPGLAPAPEPTRVGEEHPAPTAQWRLTPAVARAYAEISGDRNPIHTHGLAAKAFGFAKPIAHGMYTAARALATVGTARGPAFEWAVEFAAPVLLPATVQVALTPDGAGGWHYEGWSRKPHFAGTVTPLADAT